MFKAQHDTIIGYYTFMLDSIADGGDEAEKYISLQENQFQVFFKIDTAQRRIKILNPEQFKVDQPYNWAFDIKND